MTVSKKTGHSRKKVKSGVRVGSEVEGPEFKLQMCFEETSGHAPVTGPPMSWRSRMSDQSNNSHFVVSIY